MGVPSMFRWLSRKYPKILSSVQEEFAKKVDDETIPVDRTQPNPNGEEFDNLYLDMNGIVHPCSHPEDKPAPKTEADMMIAIFELTDRVVGMVRPRKLLYLAVDGVAPRAKMNQQRSRRFRSAQEAKEKDEEMAEQRQEFLKMLSSQKASRGEDITSLEEVIEKTWDSNAITPGTPFMHMLAESLQYWCAYKFTTDPSWQDMKVIISDASVPGEGEHKIMNFIRSQRAMPTHNPNTRHVIYGLDADLIMLGLATHEPHFRILREDVFFDSGKDKVCIRCGRKGHHENNCPHPDDGKKLTEAEAEDEWSTTEHPPKPHIWLNINVLREYLGFEMEMPGRKFTYNLERALDDWVFMCFFVGNDFLPHLPSLEIRDQGIDLLTGIWRELVPQMDDYVTKDGYPNMQSVQQILKALAGKEADIFRKRKEISDRQAANHARRDAQKQRHQNGPPYKRVKEDTSTYTNAGVAFFDPHDAQSKEVRAVTSAMMADKNQSNKSAAAQLKALMKAKDGANTPSDTESQASESVAASASGQETSVTLGKRTADAMDAADNGTPGTNTPVVPEAPTQPQKRDGEMPADTVKLWEEGYEERYYAQKFNVAPDDLAFRHKVARDYAEGLCWVLSYYFQGCQSWTWYFPYHYAPFAADFVDIGDMEPRKLFTKGVPFHPYEQLMGVLPAASGHTIPEPYRILMSDPNSPIVDFYPEDFKLDLNGKKFAWQGVAILPFIDEKRLLAAMATKYDQLTDDEKKRNEFGKETLMFSQNGKLFKSVNKALYRKGAEKVQIDPEKSQALHGEIEAHDLFVLDGQLVPPFDVDGDTDYEIIQDGSMRVYYEMPKIEAKRAHKSVLLKGLVLPQKALTEWEEKKVVFDRDHPPRNDRGGYRGGRGGGRGGRGGFNDNGRGGNNQGGYNNNRGGYDNGRGGGYQNVAPPPNRGGYNNGGGGYDNSGGYNNGGGGYNNNNNRGGGYNNNNGGGGYNNGGGGYNNGGGRGGFDNRGGYGGRGGYSNPAAPPFIPGAPWPPVPPNGQYLPPPPPGWVPPNNNGGRPAWMNAGPPPPPYGGPPPPNGGRGGRGGYNGGYNR